MESKRRFTQIYPIASNKTDNKDELVFVVIKITPKDPAADD